MMDSMQSHDVRRVSGIGLVLLGLLFFVATQGWFNLNWGNSWPAYLIILGLVVGLGAWSRGNPQARAGGVTFGALLVGLGLFFFVTTLGYLSWDNQGTLWPIYPLILGGALLLGYVAGGLRQPGFLTSGLVLAALGALCLALTPTGVWSTFDGFWRALPGDWNIHWPLFLLLASLLVLAGAFVFGTSQSRPGSVTLGTLLLGLGLFFYATTLGYLSWDAQGRLWPVYPLVFGLALLLGYFASAQTQRGYLIGGLIVTCASGVALLILLAFGNAGFDRGWPLFLVALGVGLLFLRSGRHAPVEAARRH